MRMIRISVGTIHLQVRKVRSAVWMVRIPFRTIRISLQTIRIWVQVIRSSLQRHSPELQTVHDPFITVHNRSPGPWRARLEPVKQMEKPRIRLPEAVKGFLEPRSPLPEKDALSNSRLFSSVEILSPLNKPRMSKGERPGKENKLQNGS